MSISNKDFVHMHCHSTYSQFDGLPKVKDFVFNAKKMGFKAVALTDHGNVMGWIEFLRECKEKKEEEYPAIKPILGSEMYLSRQMDIGQYDPSKTPKDIQKDGRKGNRHLNLYAMNYKGYQNLCTLSQKSWTKGFYSDPRIDIDLLSKHSEGLMCGSACLSSVINFNLLYGKYDNALQICGMFNEMFKGNFFLEVMYHGLREEKAIIPDILKISSELNIPVVATNDTHYIKKEHSSSQEVLMCMNSSKCIKDPKRIHFPYNEFYFKSAQEMLRMFKDIPHVITNSKELADRIDTASIERELFGGMKLPVFNIPKDSTSPQNYLEKLAWEGLKKQGWDKSKEHVEALKKELNDVRVAKDVNNYDFATYFLIVRDYIQQAKERGVLAGCGRGSGYASVLLRCLGITYGADPIKYSLIWERFLGFDDVRFIKESDFGLQDEINTLDKDELDEDRELEDDLGGVDRY